MTTTYTTSQAPYLLLVANLDGAAAPEAGIPAPKARTGFRLSHIQSIGLGSTMQGGTMVPTQTILGIVDVYADGAPTRPEATLTVVSNVFAGDSARLYVGPFVLVSYVHYIPGAGVAATATALAAAIDALPGYDAVAVGADVTVEGPVGALGVQLRFYAEYTGGEKNFDFVWPVVTSELGYLSNPPLSPPGILP